MTGDRLGTVLLAGYPFHCHPRASSLKALREPARARSS